MTVIVFASKVTVLSLELASPTMPDGMVLKMDLTDKESYNKWKTFTIKEGVPYKCVLQHRLPYFPLT